MSPYVDAVSILVVLDVVLEVCTDAVWLVVRLSFNPCCAGCSSGSLNRVLKCVDAEQVSILVVLDVVLEDRPKSSRFLPVLSFNPCCAGCSSGSITGINTCPNSVEFQSLLCWM